ncbi:MAG: DNA-directed RNA polymerase subunit omega [Desulfarculales bacterium]|nr:DNA-directed RNA polymerase subunit omega [Desulfarculales bacterium]
MARITVEDCLQQVDNRFSLVHMAAKRVRQLRNGAVPQIKTKNKDIVVALREIASGAVYTVGREPAGRWEQTALEVKPDED